MERTGRREQIVQIVVPSHKRWSTLSTPYAIDNCLVCIPESQLENYADEHPDIEFVTHPDSIKGISAKRQWIYEKFKNVYMADDDILYIKRNYTANGLGVHPDMDTMLTPEEAYHAVQHLAGIAIDAGIKMFGFNHAGNPKYYKPQEPFSLNKVIVGASLGLLWDSRLHFPLEDAGATCDDHYITLLNAYYNRINLVDNRYSMAYIPVETNTGGLGGIRTVEAEKNAYHFLREKFGKAVQRKRPKVSSGAYSHEWERVLDIPL